MPDRGRNNRYELRADQLREQASRAEATLREVLLTAANDYVELANSTCLVERDRIQKRLLRFEVGGISKIMRGLH
jgi:hypothetical protein